MKISAHNSGRPIALSILMGLASTAHADDRCSPYAARVVSSQGYVDMQLRSEEAWVPAPFDTKLCPGDKVTVRQSSRAIVRLEQEQTNVQLGENSTLVIPVAVENGYSVVELLKGIGHFISRVPRALTVKTPFVNAAVEGTEFVVSVAEKKAVVFVSEGRVKTSNDEGSVVVGSGESAVTAVGDGPRQAPIDEPMEVVQWALYYPRVIDFERYDFSRTVAENWRPAIADSIDAYRVGDMRKALELLAEAPDDARDARLMIYRANVLLSNGQVSAALEQLRRAAELEPDNSNLIATQAVIAAVQNQRETALTLAQKAVSVDPSSAASLLAMSYAQQVRFDLDAALYVTREAVKKEENNSLAWARLAEIWLMIGELEEAEVAAKWALKYNPQSAQAHTVRGYAASLRGEFDLALDEFTQAATNDQAAPLARLGLGLTHVRLGDLADGRADMEIATSLDPRNALLRSYVGKAYFDEKRDAIAEQQFNFAKQLDPNDPTPWFYDALLKQAQNRPVEALQNMQRSIDLNDNRAVYRSRLLLDEDRAVRSTNLARLYTELGFDQYALVEGYQSVNIDPTNYTAHRFLADVYAGLPRHEIARVSELLQAKLLQPLSQNPIQPELTETDLSVLNGSNVLSGGLNEYNALLMRGGMSARVGVLGGSNNTFSEEVSLSYLGDRNSATAGQFHFETDGFRENADFTRDVTAGFYQVAMGPFTSAQIELRSSQTERGDISLRFDPDNFFAKDHSSVDARSQRAGIRHQFDSSSYLLTSFVRATRKQTDFQDHADEISEIKATTQAEDRAYLGEIQYISKDRESDWVSGYSYVDSNSEVSIDAEVIIPPFPAFFDHVEKNPSVTQNSLYGYWTSHSPGSAQLTLGLTYDIYSGAEISKHKFNPKIGMLWDIGPATTLRLAAFRNLKRILVADQTLEPTQVAGFNQFYDDYNATLATRYGAGLDHRISSSARTGIEVTRRELQVPFPDQTKEEDEDELDHRLYWYWTPGAGTALGVEYFFERFSRKYVYEDPTLPRGQTTQRFPITLHLAGPLGWSVQFKATAIRQEVAMTHLEGASPYGFDRSSQHFELFDVVLGYRFAKGTGITSLAFNNLFDRHFGYEDTNFQTNEPRIPLFYPERTISLRASLRF